MGLVRNSQKLQFFFKQVTAFRGEQHHRRQIGVQGKQRRGVNLGNNQCRPRHGDSYMYVQLIALLVRHEAPYFNSAQVCHITGYLVSLS